MFKSEKIDDLLSLNFKVVVGNNMDPFEICFFQEFKGMVGTMIWYVLVLDCDNFD